MTIQSTLITSALFALLSASIYAYVGWRLNKRIVSSSEGQIAWNLLIVWWYGLAVTTLIGGLLHLFGALGLTNLPLFVTATYINIQVSCLALFGLFYYLVFLFTGNSRWLTPLAVLYTIYYILLIYYLISGNPANVALEPWGTTLTYRTPPTGPFLVLAVLLFASQIIGGLAYFTVYFRVTDATQKYRILLVSWSIIIWFLSPFVGIAAGLEREDWWQFASRIIGLAAALTILTAYMPTHWVKQRFGVLSLADENLEK